MSALLYAPDERRPPVPLYVAGEGVVKHWAGFNLTRSGADRTLHDHLIRAGDPKVPPESRAKARLLADQLTAAMKAAFGPQEGR